MDKPTDELEYEMTLLSRHLGFVQRGPLDRSAYIVLSRVLAEGPMTIRALSEAFGLDQSTLNRQTSAMLRAGLLVRIPDPDGGIARKFQVTEEGERRLEEQRRFQVDGIGMVVADWSPAEVADFVACLARFNTDIERLSGRPWPRP